MDPFGEVLKILPRNSINLAVMENNNAENSLMMALDGMLTISRKNLEKMYMSQRP